MVEHIEELAAELNGQRILDRKVLEDAHVPVEETGTTELTFTYIAECSDCRKRERRRIEPLDARRRRPRSGPCDRPASLSAPPGLSQCPSVRDPALHRASVEDPTPP